MGLPCEADGTVHVDGVEHGPAQPIDRSIDSCTVDEFRSLLIGSDGTNPSKAARTHGINSARAHEFMPRSDA
jgi:hypothetical protein